MPLEPCYECNKEISTLARSCPNCGAPSKNTKKKTSSIPTTSEWTAEDDKKLLSLYKKKVPEFALAKILKKRLSAVRERIIFLMKKN